MSGIIEQLLELAGNMGYGGIALLMAVESSFIPFPSEIVIPPAAYLARNGTYNIFGVIGAGVAGSLIGAVFNYYIAMWLGRPLVYRLSETRWARMILINRKNIEKAEEYFLRYGNWSTFFGRLIAAVRQLISLPAGFARMRFSAFLAYTALGSTLWVTILATIGYAFGAAQELEHAYYVWIKWGLVALAAIGIVFFLLWQWRRNRLNKRPVS